MSNLLCKIELSKEHGISLLVENEEGKITQKAVFDGSKMTITCKGEKESSTITQTPDSIALKCKTFSLDAETISTKSTKASKHVSKKTFAIESDEDLSLNSKAALEAKAAKALSAKGKEVSLKGSTKASLEGQNTDIKAGSNIKISGMNVEAAGKMKSAVKGMQVAVESSGPMNIKGAATNIQGSMIRLAGMVKLG